MEEYVGGRRPIRNRVSPHNSIERLNRKVEHLDIGELWGNLSKRLKRFHEKHQAGIVYGTLWTFLRVSRQMTKLALFLLAPIFLHLYGSEITLSADTWYYSVIGWCLISMCYSLPVLFIFSLLAKAPVAEREVAKTTTGRIGGVLLGIDVIGLGIIFVIVLLVPAHEFRVVPLRWSQDKIDDWVHDPTVKRIAGVTNNADESVEFTVRHDERGVTIFAVGEVTLRDCRWIDYGRLEDSQGAVIWEMTDCKTTKGDISNVSDKVKPRGEDARRTFIVTHKQELAPGRYVLRYISDGSYAVNMCGKGKEPDQDPEPFMLDPKKDGLDVAAPLTAYCWKIKVTVEK